MPEVPPREIVAQRYRLLDQIGKGGMGSVWRAEHVSLRTQIAIKLLDPRLAHDPVLRARFLREAQSAAALRSANVVAILDHGVDEDLPYIAMELLEGESLRERLRRTPVLDPASLARILAGVCRAVARAHRAGIVHRDLKPDNIFLAKDDEQGEVVKVVDFGIAKLLDDAGGPSGSGLGGLGEESPGAAVSTATGTMLGTPYYMSPEQLRGRKEIDARADLWALGVIAFECLTGRRPFVADAVGELVLTICASPPPIPSEVAAVPAGFDALFAKAVARALPDRFQTAQELAAALEEVLSPGEGWLPAEPEGGAPRPSLPSSAPRVEPHLATAPTELVVEVDRDPLNATAAAHAVSSVPTPRRPGGSRFALAAAAVVVAGAVALGYATMAPADEDLVAQVRRVAQAARAVSSAVAAASALPVAPSAVPLAGATGEPTGAPTGQAASEALPPPSTSAAPPGSRTRGRPPAPKASASAPAAPSASASAGAKLPKLQE